ncbi:MAG: hypothetical protein Q4F60_01500 [Candidatus Saccharibacteria bacterium]|nr:hypothetical protein [Candidatus Saccharibacteria bacterium]
MVELLRIIPKWLWGVLGLVILGLVTIIAISSFRDEVVSFKNGEVIKEMPVSKVQDVKEKLHLVVEEDVGVEKEEKIEVEIRDYSVSSEEDGNGVEIKTAGFLADNEKYQRSYMVVLSWAVGRESYAGITTGTMITCPDLEKTKYPEAKCKAMNGSSYKDYEEKNGK